MRRRRALPAGLALAGILTLAALPFAAPTLAPIAGADLRARGSLLLAPLAELSRRILPDAPAAAPELRANARVAVEDGRTIVRLTPEERARPELIKGRRRQRIARGSGTTVQQVNQLVKQFGEMRKMMKGLSSGKMPDLGAMMRQR